MNPGFILINFFPALLLESILEALASLPSSFIAVKFVMHNAFAYVRMFSLNLNEEPCLDLKIKQKSESHNVLPPNLITSVI